MSEQPGKENLPFTHNIQHLAAQIVAHQMDDLKMVEEVAGPANFAENSVKRVVSQMKRYVRLRKREVAHDPIVNLHTTDYILWWLDELNNPDFLIKRLGALSYVIALDEEYQNETSLSELDMRFLLDTAIRRYLSSIDQSNTTDAAKAYYYANSTYHSDRPEDFSFYESILEKLKMRDNPSTPQERK